MSQAIRIENITNCEPELYMGLLLPAMADGAMNKQ